MITDIFGAAFKCGMKYRSVEQKMLDTAFFEMKCQRRLALMNVRYRVIAVSSG